MSKPDAFVAANAIDSQTFCPSLRVSMHICGYEGESQVIIIIIFLIISFF